MPSLPPTPPHRPERRVLDRLAALALAVEGVDHAAVGWVGGGSLAALGATSTVALVLTEKQVSAGAGPVCEAVRLGRAVAVEHVATALAGLRLAALAAAHDVAAVAAHPVLIGDRAIGVVALYAERPALLGVPREVVAEAAAVLAPHVTDIRQSTTVELAAEELGRERGVTPLEALVAVRAHARREGLALEEVAAGILDGTLVLEVPTR